MSQQTQIAESQLQRRIEELIEANRQLEIKAQISQLIASSLDVETLTKQVVKTLKNVFGLNHVAIYLLDPSPEWLTLKAAAGTGSQKLQQQTQQIPTHNDCCFSWVYRTQKPYISYQPPPTAGENGAFVIKNHFVAQTKSELALPLPSSEQVIGILDLQSAQARPFDDISPYETMASQLAPAIDKLQQYTQAGREYRQAVDTLQQKTALIEELESSLRETHLMLDISRNLSGASTFNEVYDALVQSIHAAGAKSCTLYLCSELDSNNLPTFGQISFTNNAKALQNKATLNYRFPLSKYEILDDLIYTQETLVIEDIETDQRLSVKEQEFFRQFDVGSMIINPLVVRGHVTGLLAIEYQQPRVFSQRELALLRTICNQTTTAIEHARQIRLTEEALTETQTLYRAGRVLAGADDLQDVLQEALVEFVYSFGLDQGGITLLTADGQFGQLRAYLENGQLQDVEKLRFPINKGIVYQKLLLDGQPFTSYDVANDVRLAEFRSFNQQKFIRSTLQAPMIIRGETIGWIGVDAVDEYKEFAQKDIDLARAMADQIAIAIQNNWLLEQTERRAEQLKAVASVGEAMTGLMELDEVLKTTVNLIRDRFGFYHVSIFLLDDQREWAVVRASTGEVGRQMVARPHKLKVGSNSIVGYATHHAQPRIALDVGEDKIHFKNPLLPDTRSEMALPLVSRGVVIGALDVQSVEANAFTHDDVETLQVMANQITTAIENAQLFEQTQRRLNEQAMLYRIGTRIGGTLRLQETTDILVSETADALNVAECALTLLEENSTAFVISDFVRKTSNFKSDQGQRYQIDEFISWASILATKQEIVIHLDNTQSSGWEVEYLREHGGTALAIVPILLRNKVIGLLEVFDDKAGRRFTQEDISLLDSIALQAANAIENARLFAQTQRTLEQTQTLLRISHALSQAAEEQNIFEFVMGQSLQFLDLKQGTIMLFDKVRNASVAQARYIDGHSVEPNLILPFEEDLVCQQLQKDPRPLVIQEPKTHPLTKKHQDTRGQLNATAMLFIPLITRDRLLGSIVFDALEDNYIFNQSDIEIGQSIADQLTIWLENRRLLAEAHYRTERLETAAEVSRAASSILDIAELINTSVNVIREQFNFYYVGLFLVDEAGEWAVLKAGTGEAGRLQIENNHRLKVGSESMIGWSVANRQARIALDVGEEAVRFQNPYLPETHSEMALPLISRDQVLGALTVQSTERGAFSNEDITMLQTMADQLANAIENANLFAQTQEALAEAETLYQITQELASARDEETIYQLAINTVSKTNVDSGAIYMYLDAPAANSANSPQQMVEQKAVWTATNAPAVPNGARFKATDFVIEPVVPRHGWFLVEDVANSDRITESLRTMLRQIGVTSLLVLPLSTYQARLGFLVAAYKIPTKTFADKQIRFFTTLAQQIVTALENIRLLDASQRRARREEVIRDISLKIRSAVDVDDILKTTVTELGKVLGVSRGNITLGLDTLSAPTPSGDSKEAVQSNGATTKTTAGEPARNKEKR
jgi:GAF domain-containing protein